LNTNKTVSPFDYLYIENANMHHIYDEDKVGVFTPEMFAAIDSLAAPSHLLLENKTISSGESVAYEAENVTVSNVTVKPGGSLEISAKKISVQPEFHAEVGSTVHLKVDSSWICPEGSIQTLSFTPLSDIVWEEVSATQIQSSNEQVTNPIVQEMNMGNEIRYFPNPVENILNIQLLNRVEGEIKITVINMQGQIVYSQLVKNNVNNTVNCSQFAKGVYFVKIAFKDSARTIKIIKR